MTEEVPLEAAKQVHLVLDSRKSLQNDSTLVRSVCALASFNRK